MKQLRVPPAIELVDAVTDEPTGKKLSFKDFVVGTLLSDPEHFGSSAAAVDAYIEIKRLVRGAKEGDVVKFEDAHAERLQTACTSPSQRWVPGVLAQLTTFRAAIKDMSSDSDKSA